MKIGSIYLLLFMAGFCSCSGKLEQTEYVEWVKDYRNELHVKRLIGDFVFDLQFTPSDYVWLQRADEIKTEDRYQQEKKELDDMQYYTLTISMQDESADFTDSGIQDASEKQRKLYYFSYLFQNDIQLEDQGHLFPCVLFHFERPVDLKHSRTFVLGFSNLYKDSKESRLIINSNQFGSLPVKIKVSKKNIPALAI